MPMRWHESILKVIDHDVTLAYVMAKVERTFLEGHTFQQVCRAKWRPHWCFTFFVDAPMSTPLACLGSQNKAGSHVGQHSFWCFSFFFWGPKALVRFAALVSQSLPTRFSRLVMTDQTSSFLFDGAVACTSQKYRLLLAAAAAAAAATMSSLVTLGRLTVTHTMPYVASTRTRTASLSV